MVCGMAVGARHARESARRAQVVVVFVAVQVPVALIAAVSRS